MMLMLHVFWYRITRWMYQKERNAWADKAVRYQQYVEFMSSENSAPYWMRLSHRERVILMEFLLGVALGRFTEEMVQSYVNFFTQKSEKMM